MAAAVIDFWYEFASTYSYLSAMRIAPLAEQAGVTVRWRPFLLGPIFQSQGLTNSPFVLFPVKGDYMVRDMQRLCADAGVTFQMPQPFPQNTLLATRVAMVAFEDGFGEAFTRAVYTAEFADGAQIADSATLIGMLKKLGKDADDIMTRAQGDAIKQRLREQTAEAQAKKIFGAPTFITAGGEVFWGNDRLEQALAWAKNMTLITSKTAPH